MRETKNLTEIIQDAKRRHPGCIFLFHFRAKGAPGRYRVCSEDTPEVVRLTGVQSFNDTELNRYLPALVDSQRAIAICEMSLEGKCRSDLVLVEKNENNNL